MSFFAELLDNAISKCTGLPTEQLPAFQVDAMSKAQVDTPVRVYPHEAPMLKLNPKQYRHFYEKRTLPLARKLIEAIPYGCYRALFHKSPEPLSDAEIVRAVDRTSMSLFCKRICPHVYQIDLSRFYLLPTFPQFKSMGTVATFARAKRPHEHCDNSKNHHRINNHDSKKEHNSKNIKNNSHNNKNENRKDHNYNKNGNKNGNSDNHSNTPRAAFVLKSIELRESKSHKFLVTPQDPVWPFAKLMLMHNLNHQASLGNHPMTHFPMSTLIAVTEEVLPKTHPVHQFLQPHFRYTLGINDLVLNRNGSILADHNNISSPFDTPLAAVHGFDFQSAFKTYQFQSVPRYNPFFAYGRMIQKYRDCYYVLVTELVRQRVPAIDRELRQWADQIRGYIPGFPRGRDLTLDSLVDVLATIAVSVSVDHSAQHYLYSQIPSTGKPWRIRSTSNDDDACAASVPTKLPRCAQDTVDLDKINWRIDAFQEEVANHVFFNVSPASTICTLRYYDEQNQVIPLNYNLFQQQLRECCQEFPYLPLRKIAPSIDF